MPRIHLTAPAGSCVRFFELLGLKTPSLFLAIAREDVSPAFEVSADPNVLAAMERPGEGGRSDDIVRAADLTAALADDDVHAIVTLRGGAWLSRILPRIDFSVLDRRRHPIALFGFSEVTTLVNIVATYRMGRGILDMGPAFIPYGLRRRGEISPASETTAADAVRIRGELRDYFHDVVAILQGRGTSRPLPVKQLMGAPIDGSTVRFIGGNFAVLTVLLSSPFRSSLLNPPAFESDSPARPWLVLEDINEPTYRLDRFLAQFTLSGAWDRFEGILLGDFHGPLNDDQIPDLLALLPWHLPGDRNLPVVSCPRVGHTWPMSPLPLNRPARFVRQSASSPTGAGGSSGQWVIEFPWHDLMRPDADDHQSPYAAQPPDFFRKPVASRPHAADFGRRGRTNSSEPSTTPSLAPDPHPTVRFSSRVEDYIRYRPTYPPALLELLSEVCGLRPHHIVADLGSGTGILTRQLLDRGHRVYAVEPNEAMRRAAQEALAHYPNSVSVNGTAEATTLPDACVDWITAAQAFHWFDADAARRECMRILRFTGDDTGWVALIWNNRREDSPFLREYEAFLHEFGTDYAAVKHQQVEEDGRIERFFHPCRAYVYTLPNLQSLDLEGMIGRTFSSSYMPSRQDPRYAAARDEAARLFERHQRDGRVLFIYDTRVYVGRLESVA